jgi:hypothetical protein
MYTSDQGYAAVTIAFAVRGSKIDHQACPSSGMKAPTPAALFLVEHGPSRDSQRRNEDLVTSISTFRPAISPTATSCLRVSRGRLRA